MKDHAEFFHYTANVMLLVYSGKVSTILVLLAYRSASSEYLSVIQFFFDFDANGMLPDLCYFAWLRLILTNMTVLTSDIHYFSFTAIAQFS